MGCCFTLTAGEDKGFAVASSAALPLPPESSIRAIPGCGCDRMWSGWRVGGVDGRPSSSSSIRLSNSDGAGRAILTGERQTRSRAWWLLQGFPVPAATPVPVLDTDGCRPALTQAQCSPAPLPSGSGIPLRAQIAEFFCRIHKVVAAPANEWGEGTGTLRSSVPSLQVASAALRNHGDAAARNELQGRVLQGYSAVLRGGGERTYD
jgi:hypothetical protein